MDRTTAKSARKPDIMGGKHLGETLEPVIFEASIGGRLSDEPRGEINKWLWSPLGQIFIYESHDRTLAELTQEEYEEFSREKPEDQSVFLKFGKWLVEREQ